MYITLMNKDSGFLLLWKDTRIIVATLTKELLYQLLQFQSPLTSWWGAWRLRIWWCTVRYGAGKGAESSISCVAYRTWTSSLDVALAFMWPHNLPPEWCASSNKTTPASQHLPLVSLAFRPFSFTTPKAASQF